MRCIITAGLCCLLLACSGDRSDELNDSLNSGKQDASADGDGSVTRSDAGLGDASPGDLDGEVADDAAVDAASDDAALPSGEFERVARVALGFSHGCAQMVDGRIKCWGSATNGQLGRGDDTWRIGDTAVMGPMLKVVQLGGQPVVQMSLGNTFTCVRFDNGQVKCWGFNRQGQLGQDSTTDLGLLPGEPASIPPINLGAGRTALEIGTGFAFACARLDDGNVKCWGNNDRGQLGQGDLNPRGDAPGEMAALAPVALGTGRTAKRLTVGWFHVCVQRDDDSLVCWGDNVNGTLGRGAVANPDNRIGDQPGETGDALVPFNLGTGRTVQTLSGGGSQTCALLDGGKVKCWGINQAGRLGIGDELDRGDQPNELGDNLPEVNLPAARQAVQLVAATRFSCALLDDAQLTCWGANNRGYLGLGDTLPRGNMPGTLAPMPSLGTGRTVVNFALSDEVGCAVLDNERVKCWGDTGGPLLGQTDLIWGDQPGELGDALPYLDFGKP